MDLVLLDEFLFQFCWVLSAGGLLVCALERVKLLLVGCGSQIQDLFSLEKAP